MPIPDDADPIALFRRWFADARAAEPYNADAAALATAGADGRPAVRMVLVKAVDERGFVFYTNSQSRKGAELAVTAYAALCFYWKEAKRQVRVTGPVSIVGAEEADRYFASRSREARIGAWASEQSRPLAAMAELEARVRETEARFGNGPVDRPPHWLGYRVAPSEIEFWEERPYRLHERLVFHRDGAVWRTARLYP